MTKEIRLNAFLMNCVGHLAPGQWTNPEDTSSDYLNAQYWVDLAELLERGLFDTLFLGDVTGVYDVDGGTAENALTNAAQTPMNDPFPLISLMAHATRHLGFGVTASVAYDPPYLLARRFTTLDHLTKGRVAWNIVTSYLESGARSLGQENLLGHDERYDRADEYLDLCYRFWEDSWDDGAVSRDAQAGKYVDPAGIHAVNHEGRYFRSHGIFQCEPSPQRTPLIFQAGGSQRGGQFAARHAECVFVGAPTREGVRRSVAQLQDQLHAAGRKRDDVRIFAMFTVIVEETAALARQRHQEYLARANLDGARALLSGWTGIDLSRYSLDDELVYVDTNAGQSALASFSKLDPSRTWTLRDALEFVALGGRGPVVVGDAREVADELQGWVNDTGIDGFNLAYIEMPRTFRNIVDYLVPELQRRGAYKRQYADGVLREKLLSAGPYRTTVSP
ncbi:FMN-dependent oxidoreductase (nitrilotriacetate monooxygenase family) [Advenella incenata]|uniref:FMN-dependent oxidoreductase (Nitrilotriacetate monooxygenase family) n=1 Tax=Advenella incenata TaxID=267800 RepID=A0A4Q7VEK9_9BURK|nr:LLM class flavin-dependent oxidoreductase [Advenella incenata]RZT94564.1 FMN-dependent oxidoreductase (nitrilotriacetate monooxygenase family) [Advenella incenata]